MVIKRYFVYLLASSAKTIYIGVTSDLRRRLAEDRSGSGSRFTQRYRVHHLVYCETYRDARDALRREKQLKGWRRSRKVALIGSANPDWLDLASSPWPEQPQE